jgi:hypothetical protein
MNPCWCILFERFVALDVSYCFRSLKQSVGRSESELVGVTEMGRTRVQHSLIHRVRLGLFLIVNLYSKVIIFR